MLYTFHDIMVVAQTVFGEARNQSMEGQRAVAHVINNRLNDRRWPNEFKNVCHQPKQFSCWNKNDPNLLVISLVPFDDPVFRRCFWISAKVMAGDDTDNTSGANHYHSPTISAPIWAEDRFKTTRIGDHIFYNIPPLGT